MISREEFLKEKSRFVLGTVNYEQTKSLFRDLLSVFNKILLPTHDSSHVQFLLFYICSFHTVSLDKSETIGEKIRFF